MSSPLESLLQRYKLQNPRDYENALKEIIQELALIGLSRADFFNRAAFYGGTALRIFHGLSRFSEDLDFTLLENDPGFSLKSYFGSVRESLRAFGLEVEIEEVCKQRDSQIESAFLKGNTRMHLLQVRGADRVAKRIPFNKTIKVKFEVDVQPATGFTTEVRFLLPPLTSSVRILTPPSLFAGKMHAVLFRGWNTRVKGRDFYDLLWYLGQRIPLQLSYLEAKMIEGNQWDPGKTLTRGELVTLLKNRFEGIDFSSAAAEVAPFLRDFEEVSLWSRKLFLGAIDSILIE
jgi:hypothetical protein